MQEKIKPNGLAPGVPALLILTLCYAIAEVFYHVTLLNWSADPDLSESTVKLLEAVGCTLAASGFVLLFKRFVRLNGGVAFLMIGLLAVGIYTAIDQAIDHVPRNHQEQAELLAKQKVMGVRMRFEMAALEGERFNNSFVHKAMLGHSAIRSLTDGQSVKEGLSRLREKSTTLGSDVAEPLVQDYLQKSYELLRRCRVCTPQELKRYNQLAPEQKKMHPIGRRYGRHLSATNFRFGGMTLNGFSVPLGLSAPEFLEWLNKKAREEASTVASTPLPAKQLKQAVRAVWFTPVALSLSLLSVVLNLASSAGLVAQVLAARRVPSRIALAGLGVLTSAAVLGGMALWMLPGALGRYAPDDLESLSPETLLMVWEDVRHAEIRLASYLDMPRWPFGWGRRL